MKVNKLKSREGHIVDEALLKAETDLNSTANEISRGGIIAVAGLALAALSTE